MPEIRMLPSGAPRPACYVTAVEALYYAHYFHPVPGGRGWSKALMEENLPGWTLNDFMHLLQRHGLFAQDGFYGRKWRSPDVVGVVIEGDTLIEDKGNLEHPAKEVARRRIAVGSTGPIMRAVYGDDSPVVVHVRVSAATPDEVRLHEVARAAYLASPVRPSLVRNISGSLVDPFDQPPTVSGHDGPPVWGYSTEFVQRYNADMAAQLEHLRQQHDGIVLITLNVHDGGEPLEVCRADLTQLPEQLRSDRTGIRSTVWSLRADTLLEPQRADTVAALVRKLARAACDRRPAYSDGVRASGNSRGPLLEAAIEVIEREGEAALRVDAVAEMAGVTKPSIYHFFGDRDGLIIAAQAERYYRSLFIGVRQLDLDALLGTASHDEYIEMLRATFLAAMSADGVEQRRVRAQALGSAVTRPALRAAILEVHREVVATLTRVLAHGQERGWLRSDFSPSALSSWWFGISAGRHLVEEYSEQADVEAWPTLVWSAIAHLTGLPPVLPDAARPAAGDGEGG